eukprot:953523_1
MNLDKKLQIIGLGDEVCIKRISVRVAVNETIFFKNIKFELSILRNRFSTSTVWMENCEFRHQSSIYIIQGTLNAKRCIFHGPTRLHLKGSPRTSDKFIGCMF